MAELALYGNSTEPEYPFDRVVRNLEWLGPYLSSREKAKGDTPDDLDFFASLLDTILVWSRARTAGFQRNVHYPDCKELALMLDASLQQAGEPRYYRRLKFVRCGKTQFFVTCRNSPRFIWKPRFTHLDIGRNIDYCAAGHIGGAGPRASAKFLERTTLHFFGAEVVYFEALQDPIAKERWINFNRAKEQLYNETMERLGLKYRFKLFFEFPQTHREIESVMMQTTPPTAEWWEDNCLLLSTIGEMGPGRIGALFCDFRTRYVEYWELIRCIYSFGLKYFRVIHSKINSHCGFDFSVKLGLVLVKVYRKCVKEMTPSEYESLLNQTRHELDILATAAEKYLRWVKMHEDKVEPLIFPERRRRRDYIKVVSYKVCLIGRWICMHTFERWKLREPLVYDEIPIPNVSGCCAYELLEE